MSLMNDSMVIDRVLGHVAQRTSDRSDSVWREPVENYTSLDRFTAELGVMRRWPTPFCSAAAIDQPGSYVAHDAARTPIVAVRGDDGRVRAFRNACRHRGRQVVDGSGCERALTCAYHGWTYGLDGSLRGIPHRDGFPDLEAAGRGLVEVRAVERHGHVFVTQDADDEPGAAIDEIAGVVTPQHRHLATTTRDEPVNWKILMETFLEGYHIRATHRDTFYPLQYGNLNLVEPFAENCRITFPYRAIERLSDVPAAERSVDRKLTFVYHLFPNTVVVTFPDLLLLIVVDPVAVDRSTVITSALSTADRPPRSDPQVSDGTGNELLQAGAEEDFASARAVQRGLATGANTHLEFGLYEGGIAHFHQHLDRCLSTPPSAASATALHPPTAHTSRASV